MFHGNKLPKSPNLLLGMQNARQVFIFFKIGPTTSLGIMTAKMDM